MARIQTRLFEDNKIKIVEIEKQQRFTQPQYHCTRIYDFEQYDIDVRGNDV